MCKQSNPFSVGEDVIYTPTMKGRGSIIMTGLASLACGGEYKVSQVVEDDYIVITGFEDCTPSTLHWTEFRKKP